MILSSLALFTDTFWQALLFLHQSHYWTPKRCTLVIYLLTSSFLHTLITLPPCCFLFSLVCLLSTPIVSRQFLALCRFHSFLHCVVFTVSCTVSFSQFLALCRFHSFLHCVVFTVSCTVSFSHLNLLWWFSCFQKLMRCFIPLVYVWWIHL